MELRIQAIRNQYWRQDNHPIELLDKEMMDQKLDYIHNNVVESGIEFPIEVAVME